MTIRERLEQQEYMLLAPNAQKAAETKGLSLIHISEPTRRS